MVVTATRHPNVSAVQSSHAPAHAMHTQLTIDDTINFVSTGQFMSQNYSNNLETISNDQFEEMRELLEDDFVELVQTFIGDSKIRLKEIITAFKERDNLAGYEAVHSLKGACANLGAPALADLCYKLQMQCRDKNIADSEPLIRSIGEELQRVIAEINTRIS